MRPLMLAAVLLTACGGSPDVLVVEVGQDAAADDEGRAGGAGPHFSVLRPSDGGGVEQASEGDAGPDAASSPPSDAGDNAPDASPDVVTDAGADGNAAGQDATVDSGPCPDTDEDGVCDAEDRCTGFVEDDLDDDGAPDACQLLWEQDFTLYLENAYRSVICFDPPAAEPCNGTRNRDLQGWDFPLALGASDILASQDGALRDLEQLADTEAIMSVHIALVSDASRLDQQVSAKNHDDLWLTFRYSTVVRVHREITHIDDQMGWVRVSGRWEIYGY